MSEEGPVVLIFRQLLGWFAAMQMPLCLYCLQGRAASMKTCALAEQLKRALV